MTDSQIDTYMEELEGEEKRRAFYDLYGRWDERLA